LLNKVADYDRQLPAQGSQSPKVCRDCKRSVTVELVQFRTWENWMTGKVIIVLKYNLLSF